MQAELMNTDMRAVGKQADQSYHSFVHFYNNIFPLSFVGEKFIGGAHLNKWCKMYEESDYTCILAPRKHSKSVTVYAWLMWRLAHHMNKDYELLYMSFKQSMAAYHIKRFKQMVENNPYFREIRDMSKAEGVARYTWNGINKITIEPEGILSFKRGRHPDDIILDDILSDPTTLLDLGVIEKINQRVMEDVMSLPKEGGQIKVVGTAQTPVDFFFKLKDSPRFKWGEFPAVTNWKTKEVLWKQQFPFERLMEIRDHEIGEKAFQKEYMIMPAWSADSFFRKEQIDLVINKELPNVIELKTKNEVGAGWDIGKHSHPAYYTVFEFNVLGRGLNMAIQRYHIWMDGWEYHRQLEFIIAMNEDLRVDYCNFDATRGELEGFWEKGMMNKSVFHPVIFSTKSKNKMASEFEKRVTHKNKNDEPSPLIMLNNTQRQINQILTVTNDLQAIQTHEGHGDSFWGIALALHKTPMGEMRLLQDPENITGLF